MWIAETTSPSAPVGWWWQGLTTVRFNAWRGEQVAADSATEDSDEDSTQQQREYVFRVAAAAAAELEQVKGSLEREIEGLRGALRRQLLLSHRLQSEVEQMELLAAEHTGSGGNTSSLSLDAEAECIQRQAAEEECLREMEALRESCAQATRTATVAVQAAAERVQVRNNPRHEFITHSPYKTYGDYCTSADISPAGGGA